MKKFDVVCKTGTYTSNGEEKARWLNVGAVIEGKNGLVLLLNRTFNPAGVQGEEGENVILSLFPADRDKGKTGTYDAPF